MPGASNYLENAVLNHVLRATTYTAPSSVWIGLHTGTGPDETGNVFEVAGNNYTRTGAFFGASTTGGATNTGVITFPTPSATWGIVTSWGLFDAATAGNLLYLGALNNSKTINVDDSVTFQSGSLGIYLD